MGLLTAVLVGANLTVTVTVDVEGNYPYIESVVAGEWKTGHLGPALTASPFRALGRPTVGRKRSPPASRRQRSCGCARQPTAPTCCRHCPLAVCGARRTRASGCTSEYRARWSTTQWYDHIAAATEIKVPGIDCGRPPPPPPPKNDDVDDVMIIISFCASLLALGLLVGVILHRPRADITETTAGYM